MVENEKHHVVEQNLGKSIQFNVKYLKSRFVIVLPQILRILHETNYRFNLIFGEQYLRKSIQLN